jgi:hypothetical protein
MKSIVLFAVYALALFNCYIWLISPELFYAVIWKWDIFVTLLFAPLIYALHREHEEKKKEVEL